MLHSPAGLCCASAHPTRSSALRQPNACSNHEPQHCHPAPCLTAKSQHLAGQPPRHNRGTGWRHSSNVAARGILDTYRQDKAIAEQQAAASEPGADDPPCTAECVAAINSVADLERELEAAGDRTLVVLDCYKTSCGACRYIQSGFVKLCRASEEEHAPVRFLKHNIFDEYEELSDIAEKYKIRAVPLFYFFKGGEVVEQFATRERRRIASAINHHAGVDVLDPH